VSVVLGVNFHHDTAACLIVDGRIIAAEEERWSGVKHNRTRREDYLSPPDRALHYCLDAAGITAAEVDTVWAASMAPTPTTGAWASTEVADLAHLLPHTLGERLRLLSHHTAHVLSAFPLAEVDRAAGLVIDAGGSALGADLAGRERISGYHLTWSGWERVHHALPSYEPASAGRLVRHGHSLGHFYRNLAVRCIPPGDEPEGSMMALAALGDPHHYRDHLRELAHLGDEGQLRIHPPLGSYDLDTPLSLGGQVWSRDTAAAKSMQERADLAAAVQDLFEDAVVHVATHLRRITGTDTLVFAGGCALNTRLNATLAERAGFASLFVPPAPHDAGTALGAALYGWCFDLGQRPPPAPIDAAWGPHPGTVDTARLRASGHHVTTGLARDEVIQRVAGLLDDQRVVGWVQGGMEFGPRALGHRSILAHPGSRQVRGRVNRLKQRASYRPLAPAVLAEHAATYFHGAVDAFMNRTALVRPEQRERLAGVTHVDGSARVQLVSEGHGCFRDLLEAFAQRSGIPVLLNTSFNLKGRPIIRTARQAVDAFAVLDLDALAVDDTVIVRAGVPAEPVTSSSPVPTRGAR
jgi:carbamoyltransferase